MKQKEKLHAESSTHVFCFFGKFQQKKVYLIEIMPFRIALEAKKYNMIPSFIMTPRLKQPGKYGVAFVM